ncbi:MAG: biotin carboxylase N-terminal domain-containing protein [Actinomycetota bacterium]|nr:biotin carboxylase N-terminal domain-containing protein [Actinomycetota bacterium]
MFAKILIANRSEIACRVIRTCDEMGVATVVVFTEHDVGAPFVRRAGESVALPPGSSYLDIDAVVEAATRTGVSAVHPGYGFLAENAAFAAAVEEAGMTFIGPTPETIRAMGSKLEARSLMELAGVPVLAVAELGGIDARVAAEAIGYPVLVKASFGGGGKGMRIVTAPEGLLDAIASASREAASAFSDGTVYLEHYVSNPRHIEVQIFGDGRGDVVHLYERECSIQRRFQKVIEETPSPGLDPTLRERLWEAAVTAGRAVSYRGAGTVEFIVDADGGFAFLEMNTRLQVEHPVTELTTGIDLVRMQFEVAAGATLPTQDEIPAQVGHAIEVRLNAETPVDDYLPSTGVIHRFVISDSVRVDTGIEDGSVVTHHYDPLIAKVIAHAPTREEAAARLARVLHLSQIHGVDTNRDLLVRVLDDDDFLAGTIDTHFLERKHESVTAPSLSEDAVRASATAAAFALQARNRHHAPALASIPSGWRNVPFQPQTVLLEYRGDHIVVSYRMGRGALKIDVDGRPVPLDAVYTLSPEVVDVSIDGVRRRFDVNIVGDAVYVDSSLGSARFVVTPRFTTRSVVSAAGAMIARTPGVVVAVPVALGEMVRAGDTVMIVEAMKMEQAIAAPAAGRVAALHFGVGDQVDAGDLLVEIETEDDDG